MFIEIRSSIFCLSRYCECYQGSIICSNKCKCVECLNTNMSIFRNGSGNSGASLSSANNSLLKNGSNGINSSNGIQASSSSSAFMTQALTQSASQETPLDSNENSNMSSNMNKQSYGENTDSCLPTQPFFSQLSFSRQSSQSTFAGAAAVSSVNADEDSNAFSTKTKLCTSTSSGDHALQVSNNFDKLISNAQPQPKSTNSGSTNPKQLTGTLGSNEPKYTAALSLPTIKRVCILISHSCTGTYISLQLNNQSLIVLLLFRYATICCPT